MIVSVVGVQCDKALIVPLTVQCDKGEWGYLRQCLQKRYPTTSISGKLPEIL